MNKLLFMSILLVSIFTAILSCSSTSKPTTANLNEPIDKTVYGKLDTAYFAAGCFWCEEAIFESLKGVKEAVSGYAGGHTKNPTYEDVNTETTGHAESVEVLYDPQIISYKTLLKVYFASQDPTQVQGQGPDRGDSYRSIIMFRNADEQQAAVGYKNELNASRKYKNPIAVQIMPFKVFWKAEAYHQNYERSHPDNPYVQGVSIPRIERMKAQFPELLKK
jgi:peptide-methionine (S)-S-oxide reductase